jgi:hypothetical protein
MRTDVERLKRSLHYHCYNRAKHEFGCNPWNVIPQARELYIQSLHMVFQDLLTGTGITKEEVLNAILSAPNKG